MNDTQAANLTEQLACIADALERFNEAAIHGQPGAEFVVYEINNS